MTNIIQAIASAFKPTQAPAIAESTRFILSKEEFLSFQTLFKARAQAKQTRSTDILLYNIIRGKDLHRGFTLVTNPKKLAGGENAYSGDRRFMESKRILRWSTEGFSKGQLPGASAQYYNLTPQQCASILEALK
jgi:hypothetical protein